MKLVKGFFLFFFFEQEVSRLSSLRRLSLAPHQRLGVGGVQLHLLKALSIPLKQTGKSKTSVKSLLFNQRFSYNIKVFLVMVALCWNNTDAT